MALGGIRNCTRIRLQRSHAVHSVSPGPITQHETRQMRTNAVMRLESALSASLMRLT